MAEVRSLFGSKIRTAPGEAHPEVVLRMEELTAAARRGELKGVAFAMVDRNGGVGTGIVIGNCHLREILAASTALFFRTGAEYDSRSVEAPDHLKPPPADEEVE